jgi:hypothetical protein
MQSFSAFTLGHLKRRIAMSRLLHSVVVVFIAGLLMPSAGMAAALYIDDSSLTEQIVFGFGDFDNGGFSINGVNQGQGGQVTLPETAAQISFSGSWNYNPPGLGDGRHTFYLVEPDSTQILSDILDFTVTFSTAVNHATIEGTFISDSDVTGGVLQPLPGVPLTPDNTFDENGAWVYFYATNLTGGVISDIPEPSSLILLSIGAVCLLTYSWRRRIAK